MTVISVTAQDVIVKSDGSTILSKVLKVTQSEVEYKKYSNVEGPTYSISVKDILAINYENGEKDTFTSDKKDKQDDKSNNPKVTSDITSPLTSTPSLQIGGLGAYQEKEELLRSARTNKTWGTVCLVAGVGTSLAGLLLSDGIFGVMDQTTSYVLVGGGLTFGAIAGGILYGKAAHQRSEANKIKVSSLYEKELKINESITILPSVKLLTNNQFGIKEGIALGMGANITF